MSIRVVSKVWEHSVHKGSELLLLLAMADYAHDDGGGITASYDTFAKKTRLSRSQAIRLCKTLVESGEVAVHERRKNDKQTTNEYRIMLERWSQNATLDHNSRVADSATQSRTGATRTVREPLDTNTPDGVLASGQSKRADKAQERESTGAVVSELVAHYVEQCRVHGYTPIAQLKARVGKAVRDAITVEGKSPELIRQAVAEIAVRRTLVAWGHIIADLEVGEDVGRPNAPRKGERRKQEDLDLQEAGRKIAARFREEKELEL